MLISIGIKPLKGVGDFCHSNTYLNLAGQVSARQSVHNINNISMFAQYQ